MVPNTFSMDYNGVDERFTVVDEDGDLEAAGRMALDNESSTVDMDGHNTSNYVTIIVGTFFGLFAVMLVLAFFGYRLEGIFSSFKSP